MSIIRRRTLALATLLAATSLASCATAPNSVVSAPGWCAADLARHGVVVTARGTQLALRPVVARPGLQRASLKTRATGSAVLSCRPRNGALSRCVVLYEEPAGQGIGRLALGYADRVIYPSDIDGGVTAEVRFRFDAPPRAANRCS